MTSAELDQIEKELNLTLPSSYREFMQTGRFGEGDGGTQDLYGEAGEVIQANQENRRRGFYGSKWPDSNLIIGDDGAGDYYFMDLESGDGRVLLADHELTTNKDRLGISQNEHYATISEFWAFIEENHRAVEEYFERRQNKKWWQFWIR